MTEETKHELEVSFVARKKRNGKMVAEKKKGCVLTQEEWKALRGALEAACMALREDAIAYLKSMKENDKSIFNEGTIEALGEMSKVYNTSFSDTDSDDRPKLRW